MQVPVTTPNTFDLLDSCVQNLGTAVLALWGVDADGTCLCPQGKKCKASGKHPNARLCPQGVKNATRDPAILRQWVRQAPNGNWAIRCGEPLPDGGFLGVLDDDPRNGSIESLIDIRGREGELPETVTAHTGGGGGHRLYRFPHAPASRLVAPGLDLQGGGKYIVISPSKHYTGGVYTWELGLGPGDVKVADAPRWLLDGTGEAQPRPASDGGTARETVLGEAFALAGRAGPVMPDGMMLANCPQSHLHSDNRGRGQDPSCVILPPAGGSRFGGFRCQHGHCANLKWAEVLRMLPKEAVDAANRKYPRIGLVTPQKDTDSDPDAPVAADAEAPPLDAAAEIRNEVGPKLHWKEVKGHAKLVNDIINLVGILTYDPRWKGVLRYDEFAQTLRFTREPPWHPDDAPKERSSVWNDGHTTCLDLWMRRNWGLELPSDKIREGVYVVGRRDGLNPLADYLESLTWDGTPRLDTWLSTYLGAEQSDYSRSAGRKWLISAVARAYKPGSKVDTLLVLEGAQGKGKSTALRMLVPETSWFSDTPIHIGEKDAYVALRGKWIYELAELASLRKADLDKMKAFFSAPVDSYRPPYGREQISVPRTCIFAGTVNLGEYLTDSTGARRFWPVKVGTIDLQSLVADRDQIWAEAAYEYKAWVNRGARDSECPWWPSPEELSLYEAEQTAREVTHPWAEDISKWLALEKAQLMVEKRGYLMVSDIAAYALNLSGKDLDVGKATQIGVIMVRQMKWSKKRFSDRGVRVWGYVPPHVGG